MIDDRTDAVRFLLFWRYLFVVLLLPCFVSCSGGANSVSKLSIDSAAAAAKALELFDKNSDAALDDEELKQSPGLSEGKQRADADGDGRLSAEEIAQRIESWNESPRKLITTPLEITYQKRSLPEADVTLVPEPFLEEWLSPLSGRADQAGFYSPTISRELPGAHLGYYRVSVSLQVGGKERIPPQFNEQTEVGVELCSDREIAEDNFAIRIDLDPKKRR